ncbi:MAG: hypothetical protein H7Z43_05525 [Clostridia bacterium]|nr:hypothetical protein [Deltaproteobacteria bacterium]
MLAATSLALRAEEETAPTDSKAEEVIATEHLEEGQQGLVVKCPENFSASAENPNQFVFRVMNGFDDEVFLEVTDFEPVWAEFKKPGFEGLPPPPPPTTAFPDNTQLLKRLHRSFVHDKTRTTRACGIAKIKGAFSNVDLKEWVGGTVTLRLYFVGYFRSTGKPFIANVIVTSKIVE